MARSDQQEQQSLFLLWLVAAVPAVFLGFAIGMKTGRHCPEQPVSSPAPASSNVEVVRQKALENPSFDTFFAYGFALYSENLFRESIVANYAALSFPGKRESAWSNICASDNMLRQPNQAIEACKKALEIDPNFELAKNNLRWAMDMAAKNIPAAGASTPARNDGSNG